MRADYYPPWARHVREAVYLDGAIRTVSWRVRDDFRKVRDRIIERDGYQCVQCGNERRLSVHHKKPVWACIVEALLPCVIRDETYGDARVGPKANRIDVSQFNADDNLETLCKDCHNRETKRVNRKWKKRLEAKGVIFGSGQKRKRHHLVKRLIEAAS